MKFILTLVLVLRFPTPACTQTDSAEAAHAISYGIIDTILVVGNEKTKESVILREMTLEPGMEATQEALEFDRARIYSIGLFTSVDLSMVPFEGRNVLVVDVKERWYLIPLPLFGFRDGDTKKVYIGAGLLHNNFRGLNQKLYGSIVFGYDPSLAFQFADPWIDRDNNLFFTCGLSFARIRNRSTLAASTDSNFDELHYDINASLGKRFTLYNTLAFSLGYSIIHITQNSPGRTISPGGTDRYLYASLSFSHDSRNYRDYTTQGTLVTLSVAKTGFGESDVSFTRFGADLRRFIPLPLDFTLATRVFGSVVSGTVIPPYAHTYFGYGERIRGYYKTVFEGENIAGTSVELRWPLLKPRVITIKTKYLPQEFGVLRVGISLALFGDAGTTWFRGGRVFDTAVSGYGGGVVFLLPYDFVVRTEYAWNDYGRGQFIIDVRSSF